MQHTRAGTIENTHALSSSAVRARSAAQLFARAQQLTLNTPLGLTVCSLITLCPKIHTASEQGHGCQSVEWRKLQEAAKRLPKRPVQEKKASSSYQRNFTKRNHSASSSSPNLK
ncbi:hypothetical protein NDU88_002249 [Pleurodeles waltl]|uniref:Uncharacterized protein n=1 Tax=Pleurodeles waltl TaxID=8319 RepID=A0AAV7RAU4_PLEWA|nr:hypothetical protein NDU88_002249 [Pleurodeles waltl]